MAATYPSVKATLAVTASILTAIYFILRIAITSSETASEDRELGDHCYNRLDRTKATSRLVKRPRDLGYRVQLEKGFVLASLTGSPW